MNKSPCYSVLTGTVLLVFDSEEDAILASEELWEFIGVTTSVSACDKCCKFHLMDLQGLPITRAELKGSNQILARMNATIRVRRPKCEHCRSRKGAPKTIFKSLWDAQETVSWLQAGFDKAYRAYNCPRGEGYHLASADEEPGGNPNSVILKSKIRLEQEKGQAEPALETGIKTDSHESETPFVNASENTANIKEISPEKLFNFSRFLGHTHSESEKSSPVVTESSALTTPTSIHPHTSTYRMTDHDIERVKDMVNRARGMKTEGVILKDRKEILAWARGSNIFEACCLAEIAGVTYANPEFSDPTLYSRLAAYAGWAKSNLE